MSDDTPTQRFPEPNGAGPTTPVPPASPAADRPASQHPDSRWATTPPRSATSLPRRRPRPAGRGRRRGAEEVEGPAHHPDQHRRRAADRDHHPADLAVHERTAEPHPDQRLAERHAESDAERDAVALRRRRASRRRCRVPRSRASRATPTTVDCSGGGARRPSPSPGRPREPRSGSASDTERRQRGAVRHVPTTTTRWTSTTSAASRLRSRSTRSPCRARTARRPASRSIIRETA